MSAEEAMHHGPSPYHPGDTLHRGTREQCWHCDAESDDLELAARKEREFEALLAPLAAQAKALQLRAFVAEAVAELELLLSAGRPDFSPQFEAMWKVGVKQSVNRLKAMTASDGD